MQQILFRLFGRRTIKNFISTLKNRKASFYETEPILDYFVKYYRNGFMLDVGCHYGEASNPFLEMNWKVIAFEPDKDNLTKIAAHTNRKIYPYAVADTDGQVVPFYLSNTSSGISSMSAFESAHQLAYTVETISLRTVIAKENIGNIDFLKIDIEGHDYFALRGFPFETHKPEMIMCEFEDNKTISLGYTYKNMADLLVQQGYKVWIAEWYPIVKYGNEQKWRCLNAYPTELVDKNAWGNMIAVREDCSEKFAQVLASTMQTFR
jgi:FkbM family methyltransferase